MNNTFFESEVYQRSISIDRIIRRNAPDLSCGHLDGRDLNLVIRRDYNPAKREVLDRIQNPGNERDFTELIIKNNHAVLLKSANRSAGGGAKSKRSRENITKGFTNTGLISYGTRKKILNIGEIWHNAVDAAVIEHHNKYKRRLRRKYPNNMALRLITLTLPGNQVHPDQYIKRYLLNAFIRWIKDKGAINYMWRAEAQKTGKIHFHVITDTFIDFKIIRKYWVDLCRIHGYERKNASPVDIRLIKSHQLIGYVAKYISKNGTDKEPSPDQNPIKYYDLDGARVIKSGNSLIRAIDGKLWGASRRLSQMIREKVVNHFKIDCVEYWAYVNDLLKKAGEKIKTAAGKIVNRGTIDEFFAVILNRMDIFNANNLFSPVLYYAYLLHHKTNYLKLYDRGIPLFNTGPSSGRDFTTSAPRYRVCSAPF